MRRREKSFSHGTRVRGLKSLINILDAYCHDDVTVLRQDCRVFRREFIEIGNVDVFLEAITIASACNKALRNRFLKPNTIGLIPTGGYICDVTVRKL